MTTKRPYAPPADPTDVDPDDRFDDLPSDVELNFNQADNRDDEYEPDFNDEDEFEDDEDDWGDDELFITDDTEY